ncbi:MAG: acyl-CoA thioesterase/BAAT N-terminal domain-containing protein [Planctomycetota bacterium]
MTRLSNVAAACVCAFIAAASAAAPCEPVLIETPEAAVLRGDPTGVRVVGLEPGSDVTITAERTWGRNPAKVYRAAATFRADRDGEIELDRDAPIDAAWAGVDPFGLFWSAEPTDEPVPEGRSSSQIDLAMDIDGDGIADARASLISVRARDDLVRTELAPDFPGAFLLRPPGEEPLAVVIVLGGSEGNAWTAENTAPKLASRGYAVVGLPYYSPAYGGGEPDIPGLPTAFHNIRVDLLEEVLAAMRARPDIDAERAALYGVSKGAEFVLLGASLIDRFDAVIAYVPTDVVWEGWGPGTTAGQSSSFSWRGEPVSFVPYKGMAAEIAKYGSGEQPRIRTPHDAGRAAFPDTVAEARIRVEAIDAPVLVVGGDMDDVWDSGGMARAIATARERAGKPTIAIISEDAGHQLSGDGCTPAPAAEGAVRSRAFRAALDLLEQTIGQ